MRGRPSRSGCDRLAGGDDIRIVTDPLNGTHGDRYLCEIAGRRRWPLVEATPAAVRPLASDEKARGEGGPEIWSNASGVSRDQSIALVQRRFDDSLELGRHVDVAEVERSGGVCAGNRFVDGDAMLTGDRECDRRPELRMTR